MTTIYLYIKTHHVKTSEGMTLKYFGRTVKDPFKYPGSGTYWRRHLEKYGDGMDTEIYGEFDVEKEKVLLKETALRFSIDNDIVESKEWANLEVENGLDGGLPAELLSDETRAKKSAACKGRTFSAETRAKMSAAKKGNTNMLGKIHSEETRAKMSAAQKGKPKSAEHRVKMRGRPCSEETRAKMSAAKKGNTGAKGKPKSVEYRAKLSAAMKRRKKIKI